jgi:hypothetical protein
MPSRCLALIIEISGLIKKLTRQRAVQASVIDNNNNPHDIASFFAQKYSNLYSSVSYLEADMNDEGNSKRVSQLFHQSFSSGLNRQGL